MDPDFEELSFEKYKYQEKTHQQQQERLARQQIISETTHTAPAAASSSVAVTLSQTQTGTPSVVESKSSENMTAAAVAVSAAARMDHDSESRHLTLSGSHPSSDMFCYSFPESEDNSVDVLCVATTTSTTTTTDATAVVLSAASASRGGSAVSGDVTVSQSPNLASLFNVVSSSGSSSNSSSRQHISSTSNNTGGKSYITPADTDQQWYSNSHSQPTSARVNPYQSTPTQSNFHKFKQFKPPSYLMSQDSHSQQNNRNLNSNGNHRVIQKPNIFSTNHPPVSSTVTVGSNTTTQGFSQSQSQSQQYARTTQPSTGWMSANRPATVTSTLHLRDVITAAVPSSVTAAGAMSTLSDEARKRMETNRLNALKKQEELRKQRLIQEEEARLNHSISNAFTSCATAVAATDVSHLNHSF